MTKMKLILILAFVLTLAAGAALGVVIDRSMRGRDRGSHLARKLDLTPQQQKRMREIWSETLRASRENLHGRRKDLRDQREQAVRQLLNEQQRERYREIQNKYEQGRETLRERRRELFKEAREKTRKILNPDQRKKYDRFFEDRWGHGRGPDRRGSRTKGARPDAPGKSGDNTSQ
jgi:Spy/CpxP family protein refolding chaperone